MSGLRTAACGLRMTPSLPSVLTSAARTRGPAAREPGFTVVEALFALAMVAVLAAAVALSLSPAAEAANAGDAAGRLARFDRLARERARRSGRPVWLLFDIEAAVVRLESRAGTEGRGEADDNDDDEEGAAFDGATLALPPGVEVARLLVAGTDPAAAGPAAVPVSPRGQSPSYAALLAGPGWRRWVVVAGLTGRAVSLPAPAASASAPASEGVPTLDESQSHAVEHLFAALSTGHDTR